MKIRTVKSFVSRILVLAVASISFGGHAQSISQNQVQNQPMMCEMPGMAGMSAHDHQVMMASVNAVPASQEQEDDQGPQQLPPLQPDGSRDTPTHRFSPGDGCSAVNPKARDKSRDGIKPNTVGCKCARKCVNGQTQEDMSKDDKGVYICKNACHKDRCSCPDPCKT